MSTAPKRRPWMLPRFPRGLVIGLIVLGLVGWAAVASALRPREFTVSIRAEAIPADELRVVARLLRDTDAAHDWIPEEAGPAALDILVKHIRENPTAAKWVDLRRAGAEPALGLLNAAVEVLDQRLPTPPSVLRFRSDDDVKAAIRAVLIEGAQARRDAAVNRLLASPEFEAAVAPAVSPPCPPPPTGFRKWVCAAFGTPVDDRDRWAAAVLKAIRSDRRRIEEMHTRYEFATRITEAELARSGSQILTATLAAYPSPANRAVAWRDGTATVDVDIELRSAGAGDNPGVIRATGVRLLGLPIETGDQGEPKLGWPPASGVVDEAKFVTFIRGSGYPDGLTARAVRVPVGGSGERPTVRVTVRGTHDAFPDWASEASVVVWDGGLMPGAVVDAGRGAMKSLREYVAKATTVRGIPAAFRELESGLYSVRLSGRAVPDAALRLAIGTDGRLTWTGPDTLADAEKITDWLVKQNPALARHRAALRLEQVGISEKGEFTGRLVLPPAPDGKTTAPVEFAGANGAPPAIELPPAWTPPPGQEAVPAVPAPPVSIGDAMRAELSSKFEKVAPLAEVIPAGGQWVIGLRLGEWPVLRLGPVSPANEAEARAAIAKLLTPESVRAAAAAQWGNKPVTHPTYGPVTAAVKDWNPDTGKVEVSVETALWEKDRGKEFPLKWIEAGAIERGVWKLIEGYAADKAEEQLRPLLAKLGAAAGEAFGGTFEFAPDTEPGRRWVSLSPPAARLKATVRLPLGKPDQNLAGEVLKVELKGVKIDRDGLHFPEDMTFSYEGLTFVTPLCAISDPRVGFRRAPDGLHVELGIKVTPHLLAGLTRNTPPSRLSRAYGVPITGGFRADNPWIHVLYCDMAASARLRDPQFSLKGKVRAFQRFDLANADLKWTLPGGTGPDSSGSLVGRMSAGTVGVASDIPVKMSGQLNVDRRGVFVGGELHLTRFASGFATFRYTTAPKDRSLADGDPQGEIAVEARANVSAAGMRFDVDLAGWSDTRFKNYNLRGEVSTVVTFVVSRKIGVVVTVTPEGVRVTTIWEAAGRQQAVTVTAPSVDEINWDEVRNKVAARDREANGGRGPADVKANETYLRPPPPKVTAPPSPTKPPVPTYDAVAGGGGSGGGYDTVADLVALDELVDADDPPQISFKYFRDWDVAERARKGEGIVLGAFFDGLILDKSALGLGHVRQVRKYLYDANQTPRGFVPKDHAKTCQYVMWPYRGPDPRTNTERVLSGKLLVTDHGTKRLLFVDANDRDVRRRADGTATFDLTDLSSRFAGVKPFYAADVPMGDKAAMHTAVFHQWVARQYAELMVWGYALTKSPTAAAGGYAFDFTGGAAPKGLPPLARGDHTAFVWRVDTDTTPSSRVAYLHGPTVAASARTSSLFARLARLPKPSDPNAWVWVVAASADRVALFEQPTAGGGGTLKLDPAGTPVPIAGRDPSEILTTAGRAAELAWRLRVGPKDLRGVYTGPRGLALEVSTGMWFVPTSAAVPRAAGASVAVFVAWDKFDEWKSATVAHLPPKWQSATDRAAARATPAEVARVALRDWEADRAAGDPDALRWGADPLGLLFGIGQEEGVTGAK